MKFREHINNLQLVLNWGCDMIPMFYKGWYYYEI